MNDVDTIRALETLNAQNIALRASEEYAAGVQRSNLKRLLSDRSLAGIQNIIREFGIYRAVRKEPRHPEVPNLSPSEWEESLRTGDPAKRVVVYSCIVGDYDRPMPPIWRADNIDYVLFLDGQSSERVEGWDVRPIPDFVRQESGNTPNNINRYIKFHPYELFAHEYDASIYVDGNVQPISDLSYYVERISVSAGIALHHHRLRSSIADEVVACKAAAKGNAEKMDAQVNRYVQDGYPLDYGLLECNVIAADLHSEAGRDIFADWWKEFLASGSGRDQLALPYILWKHGIRCDVVATMGRNVHDDTKINVVPHR